MLFEVTVRFICSPVVLSRGRELGFVNRTKRNVNKTFKHYLVQEHFLPESRQIDFHLQWLCVCNERQQLQ